MTKITIINHDDGRVEVQGDVQGRMFDLLAGIVAHIDCVAKCTKKPKSKIIMDVALLSKVHDTLPDGAGQCTYAEVNFPAHLMRGDADEA